MNILIIDAQGGGVGKQLVSAIKQHMPQHEITAVGTNSAATAAILKAGADNAATGENAVIVGCRKADVIIGPIGIVIADSMLGEVTPAMAVAVGQSTAKKLLIPINHCNNVIIGISDLTIGRLTQNVIDELSKM
jgi:prephenate dehydrogenase